MIVSPMILFDQIYYNKTITFTEGKPTYYPQQDVMPAHVDTVNVLANQ